MARHWRGAQRCGRRLLSRYPKVLSEQETLSLVLAGSSIARFGDGELKLALGRNCISQVAHPKLREELRHILKHPGERCIVGIPNLMVRGPKAAGWDQYLRSPWVDLYDQKIAYGSAFVTRPDSAPWIDTPEFWSSVRDTWRDRDVVLVKGSERSLRVDMMPEAKSIAEVPTPYRDAYAEVGALFDKLKGETRRVLLCCGATATVLAWRLARAGVHALDLGHIGMTMRKAGQYRGAWEAKHPPVTFPRAAN